MIHRSFVLKGADAETELAAFVPGVSEWLASATTAIGAHLEYVGLDDTGAHVWAAGPPHDAQLCLATEGDGGRYFTIGAPKPGVVKRIEAALTSKYAFWSVAELAQKARASSDADAFWILMMTVAANKKRDSEVQAILEQHLGSPSRALRDNAALAAGLVRWPELRPALTQAFTTERDAQIRTTLAFVLDQIAQKAKR